MLKIFLENQVSSPICIPNLPWFGKANEIENSAPKICDLSPTKASLHMDIGKGRE
jgi:hypothetical protein